MKTFARLKRFFRRPEPRHDLHAAPLPSRRKMSIKGAAVAATRGSRHTPRVEAYTIPKAPPGVVPPKDQRRRGVRDLAMDEMPNIGAMYGYAMGGFFKEGLGFLGYPYLAELTQRAEYRRISEIIAKEMTRKWIRLTATGDTKATKLQELKDAIDKWGLQKHFQKIAEHDGWFGLAHLYADLGDTDDAPELETLLLLNAAKIPKGSLKGFKVVEPWWCYPAMFNSTDPLKQDFYRLQHWYVMGKKVHVSRLMSFVSREVPDMLKPAYCFGGISLSQIAKPYVDNWLETRQGVNDIVQAFSTFVLKTNMSAVLEDGGEAEMDTVLGRVDIFNNTRDNRGTMVIDKDTEDFMNVAAPIAGLDKLQAQSQEHICSVTGLPLIIYTGITPSGLNASSEGELAVFHTWTHAQQEQLFRINLGRSIDIVQLDLWGEIDPDIGFEFEDLQEADETVELANEKTKADIDVGYIDRSVLSAEEVRARLSADENSIYNGVDLTAPPPEPPDVTDPPEGEEDPDTEKDPKDDA